MQNTTPMEVHVGKGNEGMPSESAALIEYATLVEVVAVVVALAEEEPLQIRFYLGLEFPGLETAVALCAKLPPADAQAIANAFLRTLDSPEFKARTSEAG